MSVCSNCLIFLSLLCKVKCNFSPKWFLCVTSFGFHSMRSNIMMMMMCVCVCVGVCAYAFVFYFLTIYTFVFETNSLSEYELSVVFAKRIKQFAKIKDCKLCLCAVQHTHTSAYECILLHVRSKKSTLTRYDCIRFVYRSWCVNDFYGRFPTTSCVCHLLLSVWMWI